MIVPSAAEILDAQAGIGAGAEVVGVGRIARHGDVQRGGGFLEMAKACEGGGADRGIVGIAGRAPLRDLERRERFVEAPQGDIGAAQETRGGGEIGLERQGPFGVLDGAEIVLDLEPLGGAVIERGQIVGIARQDLVETGDSLGMPLQRAERAAHVGSQTGLIGIERQRRLEIGQGLRRTAIRRQGLGQNRAGAGVGEHAVAQGEQAVGRLPPMAGPGQAPGLQQGDLDGIRRSRRRERFGRAGAMPPGVGEVGLEGQGRFGVGQGALIAAKLQQHAGAIAERGQVARIDRQRPPIGLDRLLAAVQAD